MNTTEYTIYASFLDDINNYNQSLLYRATDAEYCSAPFKIKAKDESEALEVFYSSTEFQSFARKHSRFNIFVLAEGETHYRKVREI